MRETKEMIEELDEIIVEMKSRDKGGEDFIISKKDIVVLKEMRDVLIGVLKDEINQQVLMDEHLKKSEERHNKIMSALDKTRNTIKQINSKVEEPLGDDLIEKIMEIVLRRGSIIDDDIMPYDDYGKKAEIRKLLQSRQSEKVRITRGELAGWLFAETDSRDEIPLNDLVELFKSKGIEVVEK